MKGILLNDHELSFAIEKLEEELASRYVMESKDGTRHFLTDMTEEHLVNTINCLKRKEEELERRAEYSDIDIIDTY